MIINKIEQIWKARDLRNNILFVIGMLVIFRIAAHIPIPGVNAEALKDDGRLMSAYILPTKVKVWVLTEATDDEGRRSATTLLLPEEY